MIRRAAIGMVLGWGLWEGNARGGWITVRDGRAAVQADGVERGIDLNGGRVRTWRYIVYGREMLAAEAREFTVVISREASNRKPRGLRPEEAGERNSFSAGNRGRWRGDAYDDSRYADTRPDAPKWVDARLVEAGAKGTFAGEVTAEVTRPKEWLKRLTVRGKLTGAPVVEGVEVELIYEVSEGYGAIRKWVKVRNGGGKWLRLERMTIDDLHLAALTRKPLAAAMFGVQPSVVAFEFQGGEAGLIAASEVPSALRSISDQGAMGYTQGLFEWVLGPGEEFTSEPVFYYGYGGAAKATICATSTSLDRAVEGPYMEHVRTVIGVEADRAPHHGPQWLTWAYFYANIDDPLVRQLAGILGRAGFKEMLLDDGWQKGRLGTEIDTKKFPDFKATSEFVRSKGMALGLWVSCFRDLDSKDMRKMPEMRILPELMRSQELPGLGMSFASPWRDYYVKDLVELGRRYGVTYFKQDFTNIMYGDLAEGHESRTRKESLLRGLRGLLAAQAALRAAAPEMVNEITHEIYWGTPGVPADLAALKYTARFHIPPNECVGSDLAREFGGRKVSAEEHRAALLRGCWLARQRFYSHRGLPLNPLEFYAAATVNHEGSLTPEVQDRQVASWLMGAPVCYSGDARTLTEANIAHYAKRLAEVERLEKRYGIYKRFQFSGVPEPTDIDWHWWGKLTGAGEGAVVVVRGGTTSTDERVVNIPWVQRARRYNVAGLFSGKAYGEWTGAQLQDAGVRVALGVYGSEVLELTAR
ncbi:MAG: hypothetical protein HY821_16310 [Acidobacteria bacterium]|nr:hypothetical protein [Acidobacteriota bacterium]